MMKKIALTSLIAMFAFAGAHAANVIDGNPLYMPKAGHFYSVSSLSSHTGDDEIKSWGFGEEFGYGITDRLTVNLATEILDERSFDQWSWGDLKMTAAFRALDMGAWKADVYGAYGFATVDAADLHTGGVWPNHRPFMDKDDTAYEWTVGVRGGYTTARFTVAGHAAFNYVNSETFNWDDKGMHSLKLGLDAQYVLCPRLSVLAGVEYTGILNKKWAYDDMEGPDVKNAGKWDATLGANYNIDATKFVGAYVSAEMNHQGGTNADEWKVENGFGFGAKFGIDF